ncbi:hypothetical protein OKA04_19185 [Luteolibacter flavescens]|uniref:Condensation domain-containing protein n=1 Tax=Luteolibacter flavescens TaxID=1859460 RepID=A0ABT3FTI1_9BACT|nr:hypothetical protein [Luteolibacter flavescens]MCW1886872.1 hypothetical protein [Luteolibacter flavescens]
MPSSGQTLPPLAATCSDGFLFGLESLMRRSGQGHHLAATVVECEGEPDLAALRHAADVLGHRYPVLHARIARGGDFIARWRLDEVTPAPIPLEVHGISKDALHPLIERLLNAREPDVWKAGANLRFHVVITSPSTWTLVLIWSHSLHDAVGIDRLLLEIATPGDDRTPRSGGVDSPAPAEPMSTLYKKALPMIEEMRTFPAWRVRSFHRKGVDAGESQVAVHAFDRDTTTVIRAKMAATAGELLLLPYFASIAARAVQSVIAARHPDEQVPVLLSLPAQRAGERPLFQNHMGVYTLLLTSEDLAELKPATRALYRKSADFMRRKLLASMDALMRMMERCPSRFYNLPAFMYLKGEVCTLFHSHTGSFAPGLAMLHGSRVTNGYHVPSVCSPPGVGIFFSEYEGQLSMTLSWKDGCLSPLELELMKHKLAEDLGVPVP